jgi:hypothetical protein
MRFLTDGSCDFAIVRVPAGRLPRGGGRLDWGRLPRAPGPGRGHLRLRGETHGPAGRLLRLARVRRGAPPAERALSRAGASHSFTNGDAAQENQPQVSLHGATIAPRGTKERYRATASLP